MSCEEILVEVTARRIEAGPEAAPALSAEIEEHLAACTACRGEAAALGALWGRLALLEAEPPEAELRERFDAVLAVYQAGLAASTVAAREAPEHEPGPWTRRWLGSLPGGWGRPSAPALRLAYGLLVLLVGAGLGALLAGRGVPPFGTAAAPGDLQALRGEVRALHELVTLSLLEAPSASERLQGVSYGSRLDRPDSAVTAALVRAATEDPNVNVRLAAIEALAPVASQARVLSPLVQALPEQDSPMVQVALVDLLLASDGEAARRACTELLRDESLDPDVRRHVRERLSAL